jgi:hypothetical protein
MRCHLVLSVSQQQRGGEQVSGFCTFGICSDSASDLWQPGCPKEYLAKYCVLIAPGNRVLIVHAL